MRRSKARPLHEDGVPLRRPRLYGHMLALGIRAGVPQTNPHRFRDTLEVDLLCAGAGIYDVAQMLGDTVDTLERHYAPFVPALRERVRRIMESGNGLESANAQTSQPNRSKSKQWVISRLAEGVENSFLAEWHVVLLAAPFPVCNKSRLAPKADRPR